MTTRQDLVPESELVFSVMDDRYSLVSPIAAGAPSRFIYPRTDRLASHLRGGCVYAWVDGGPDHWGKWEKLADMRFADEQQIEAFMRTAAQLGLDTGELHVRTDDKK